MGVERLPSRVEELLRGRELTYREVGGTRGVLPDGFRHLRRRRVISSGDTPFLAAVAAVRSWRMHERAGVAVASSSPNAEPDAVVLLRVGVGPVRIAAPCRVVYVVDEPRRWGFAYGTLPGHPECGEEAFVVEQDAGGVNTLTITAFSRPCWRVARVAAPVNHAIQAAITRRYLRAVSTLAGDPPVFAA